MSAIKIRTMRAHSLIEHIPLCAAVFQRRILECFAPYLGMFSSPLSTNEPRVKHASCALCLTAPSLHATDAGRQPPPRTHDRWRRFYCDFRIVSSRPFGTEKRRTYAEQEVCGRPTRLARSFIFSGRSSERMTRWGRALPGEPSQRSSGRASLRQGALHNASFRRGIGRVSGMCRSLSLCCTASRRLPAPPGRSPRFPRPRGYTHGNGR